MKIRRAVAVAPVLLLLAACGDQTSNGPSVTATPQPKADSICQGFDQSISAIAAPIADISKPSGAKDLTALAAWYDRILTLANQEAAALKAEPTAAKVTQQFDGIVAALTRVAGDAHHTNLTAYTTDYQAYLNANTALAAAATSAGLPNCR